MTRTGETADRLLTTVGDHVALLVGIEVRYGGLADVFVEAADFRGPARRTGLDVLPPGVRVEAAHLTYRLLGEHGFDGATGAIRWCVDDVPAPLVLDFAAPAGPEGETT